MVSELRLIKHFGKSETTDAVEVLMKDSSPAIAADGVQGHVRMNLMRGVHDHGQNQIELVSDDIAKLEQKLNEMYRERIFTQRIVDVVNEYYSGADRPSDSYTP